MTSYSSAILILLPEPKLYSSLLLKASLLYKSGIDSSHKFFSAYFINQAQDISYTGTNHVVTEENINWG